MKKSDKGKPGNLPKVSRPAATDALKRSRLFGELDAAFDKKVIWISAPAGSGKTTLVSSYIDEFAVPSIWYQLDAGDADLATFFYYMGLAAKQANPRKRKPMPLLTPEYMLGIPVFARRYFEELYGRMKANALIVFDNYQDVMPLAPAMPGSGFHDTIVNAIDCLPDQVNIVIISRSEPPEEFSRLRANGEMASLGWDSIRFTPDETSKMLKASGREQELLDVVQKSTNGWAAGIVLMLASGRRNAAGLEGKEDVFDYFASEIFRKADEATRDFMLKTSVLNDITEDIAHELVGHRMPKKILISMVRNNYFTLKKPGAELAYEYHPLFREFLLEKLAEMYDADEVNQLRKHAAMLLSDSGRIEEAAALLAASGDWEALAGIIMTNAPNMLAQGRYQVVATWLQSMPEKIVQENPWLLSWVGQCKLPQAPHESLVCFEKAYHSFTRNKDGNGILLAWSGAVESIFFCFTRFEELDYWIAQFNDIYKGVEGISPEIDLRACLSLFIALVYRQPDNPELVWLTDKIAKVANHAPLNIGSTILLHKVTYEIFLGEYPVAASTVNHLESLNKAGGLSDFSSLSLLFAKLIYGVFTAQPYRDCIKTAEEAFAKADLSAIYIYHVMSHGYAALSALNADDLQTAGKYLDVLGVSVWAMRDWESSFYHFLKSFESILRKDAPQAIANARLSLKLADQVGGVASRLVCNLLLSILMREQGEVEESEKLLAKAIELEKRIGGKFFLYLTEMVSGYISLLNGNEEAASEAFSVAMSVGREKGIFQTWFIPHYALRKIVRFAIESGIEKEYVHTFIRRREIVPDSESLDIEDWPWRIRIRTLGDFSIEVDGRIIGFSSKTPRKPLELLKALIALDGDGVNINQICDLIWPDADGDKAYNSFTMSLQRLRRILKYDQALVLNGGMLSIDRRYCWVDAFSVRQAFIMSESFDSLSNPDKMEQVLQLYRGNFLPGDEDVHWTITTRELLRNHYALIISRLGASYIEQERWNDATDIYLKGIQADELSEEFYRGLLICYGRLGMKTQGRSIFRNLKNVLMENFDAEPSAETVSIYNSLISK